MSWDISIQCDTCESEVFETNVTFNLNKMFNETGLQVRDLDGKNCAEIIPALVRTIHLLEKDPEHFKQFEPENKWGTVEGALKFFLKPVLEVCKRSPALTVRIF